MRQDEDNSDFYICASAIQYSSHRIRLGTRQRGEGDLCVATAPRMALLDIFKTPNKRNKKQLVNG